MKYLGRFLGSRRRTTRPRMPSAGRRPSPARLVQPRAPRERPEGSGRSGPAQPRIAPRRVARAARKTYRRGSGLLPRDFCRF